MLRWATRQPIPLKCSHSSCYLRFSSSKAAQSKDKAFADTLLLPKTSFPLWSEPSQREQPYRKRTTDDLYKWQWDNAKGPLFVLNDGPPYANGSLHMGHALNKILKDIINRYQVLQGRQVSYIPGWDCHGLPIENKALQELQADHRDISPRTIREAARQTAMREIEVQKGEFKEFGIMADWSPEGTYRTMDHDYEMRQLRVFLEMVRKGLIYRNHRPVHWSPSSHSALAEAELTYVDDHKSRSVYVKFPVERVGMSQEFRNKVTSLENVELSTPVSLLIWTTTPWTLPANMAIAVNPIMFYSLIRRTEHPDEGILVIATDLIEDLKTILGPFDIIGELQGQDLLGTTYSHLFSPSASQYRPSVLAASYVSAESGTGLVHSAPAHGAEDYNTFKQAGFLSSTPLACPVDDDGKFTEEILALAKDPGFGQRLLGKEVLYGGTKEMINILQESGLLLAEKRIKHKYPYDWKTKKPIIVRATSQWFANVDNIKKYALKALESVNFYPEHSRMRLQAFVRERSEWCISRQRTWGVPIPSLHDLDTHEAILTVESLSHIISVLEEKGIEHWFTGPVHDFIPSSLQNSGRKLVKGTDTVDVWFDSGTAWSLLQGLYGPRTASDSPPEIKQKAFFSDVCVEGSDQHRGWFQSLLLTATSASRDENSSTVSPYRHLITHGFVLDQEGKKMSKSIGNVISPLTIIHGGKNLKKDPAYGADVLRLWAATVEYGKDVNLGPTILAQAFESFRKIRNTIRFLLANMEDGKAIGPAFKPVEREEMGLAERYVMDQLYLLEVRCKEGYDTFNFAKVVTALNTFVSQTMSSLYFDITKDCLYANSPTSLERRAVVTVLHETLKTIIPIMAPILPHMAEEAHAVLQQSGSSLAPPEAFSAFLQGWKPMMRKWQDSKADQEMQSLLKVRSVVLELLETARRQKHVRSSLEASVQLQLPKGSGSSLNELIKREADFLKTLFIVSDVELLEHSNGLPNTWQYDGVFEEPGSGQAIKISVIPAKGEKCPRCWQWTKPPSEDTCTRCSSVVA